MFLASHLKIDFNLSSKVTIYLHAKADLSWKPYGFKRFTVAIVTTKQPIAVSRHWLRFLLI